MKMIMMINHQIYNLMMMIYMMTQICYESDTHTHTHDDDDDDEEEEMKMMNE